MDYVTVRELRDKSGEIWQRIEAGEEFVVTRNGKPIALLVPTEPQAVEDRLRALRAAELGDVVRRIQQHALTNSTAAALSDDDIQSEVDAARRESALKAVVAAEPAPPGYARRR